MADSIVKLIIVLALVALFVVWLRRAGEQSRTRSARAVKDRVTGAPEADRQPRERKRKRAQQDDDLAARRAQAKSRRRDEDDDDEDDGEAVDQGPVDEAEKAAWSAGLAKTRSGGFVARLGKIFGKKQIDADVLPQLEEVLFTADIGPRAADRIFESVKKELSREDLTDAAKIWTKIRDTSARILDVGAPPVDLDSKKPFVLLTIGVNGVGKTTTIGKLAARWSAEGKKVLLAAGDTFRAAATEQLEIWAQRAGVPMVKGKPGADPSSVIFEAVKRGVDEGFDIVICDTAGRLVTKTELMDELKKVRRVTDKAMPGAPHETWMVLDATTGQNAITQAKTFKEAMEITGIVITKLDGTAKGGVILGICDELKVPVRYVGIGEKVADLRPFEPRAFVEALYEDAAQEA